MGGFEFIVCFLNFVGSLTWKLFFTIEYANPARIARLLKEKVVSKARSPAK
jgi:hypothetical protein